MLELYCVNTPTYREGAVFNERYPVVRNVEPHKVGLVLQSARLQRVEKVPRQVQLLEVGVEGEALVGGRAADSVAAQDELSQLRVERDRHDVQVTADALYPQRVVVANAPRRTDGEHAIAGQHQGDREQQVAAGQQPCDAVHAYSPQGSENKNRGNGAFILC